MNKKIKIVSSLALAGILTLNVFNTKTLAAEIETEIAKTPYNKLVSDVTNVVPVILHGKDDTVTFEEIKAVYPNAKVDSISDESKVATGDTFKVNGKTYTVLVYGDVSKDGAVNGEDALLIEKRNVGLETFDNLLTVASDVDARDGKYTAGDSLRVKQYAVGMKDTVVDSMPDEEVVIPPVDNYNYTVTVNENDMVNNMNASKSKIDVSLKEEIKTAKNLSLVIKDSASPANTVTVTVSVPANTSKLITIEDEDLSSLVDGNLSFELKDGKDVVGAGTLVKNVVNPDKVSVSTKRIDADRANASFTYYGEGTAKNVYYKVVAQGSAAPTQTDLLETKPVSMANNELKNYVVASDLETAKAYDLYYVIENNFGSVTVTPQKYVISKENGNVEEEKAIKDIVVPTFKAADKNGFEWTLEETTDKKVKVVLYNNDKIVKEVVLEDGTDDVEKVDFSDIMLATPGKYKIEVTVEGKDDGSTYASETVESAVVEVKALKEATKVAFDVEYNDTTSATEYVVSWENSNKVEDIEKYEVEIFDEDGIKVGNTVEIARVNNVLPTKCSLANEPSITILPNKVYTATVKVIAKENNGPIINSEVSDEKEFFVVDPDMTKKVEGENSITFTLDEIKINDKVPTYKVEVYKAVTEKVEDVNGGGTRKKFVEVGTRDLKVNKDNEAVIDGLDNFTEYAFKLIATVDGITGESDYIGKAYDVRTKRASVTINNVTIVNDEKEAVGNTFYYDNGVAIIKGATYDFSNGKDAEYTPEFVSLVELVAGMKLYPQDVVKLATAEKITLKLFGISTNAGNATDTTVTLGDIGDTEVEIEGTASFDRIVNAASGKVTLTGNNSIFRVEGTPEEVVVGNGVRVSGTAAYDATILANTTATVNGTKVTPTKDATMNVNDTTLTIAVNGDSKTDYTFENKENQAMTIAFVDTNNNGTDRQVGKVTILSNGGTVAVTSNNVAVTGNLDVEVQKGDATVDIDDSYLSGDKSIAVNKGASSTVSVTAKEAAPVALDVNVDISDEDLLNETGVTEDNIEEVRAYLDSFGLNGTGATIQVAADSTSVTIVFEVSENNVESTTIGNLK